MKSILIFRILFWAGLVLSFVFHWIYALLPIAVILMIAVARFQVPILSVAARRTIWESEKYSMLKQMKSPLLQFPMSIFFMRKEIKDIFIYKGYEALGEATLKHLDDMENRIKNIKMELEFIDNIKSENENTKNNVAK